VFAAFTVWLATKSVVPVPDVQAVLEQHETIMLITLSLAVGLCLYCFALRDRFAATERRLLLAGLVVLAILLVIGADRGGFMVFHFGQSVNLTTTH
ncbi:MAG: hypothetical protein ACRD5L_02085, partial [Bryobacteraceae bacterium]